MADSDEKRTDSILTSAIASLAKMWPEASMMSWRYWSGRRASEAGGWGEGGDRASDAAREELMSKAGVLLIAF